jgi:choline-sulfatase
LKLVLYHGYPCQLFNLRDDPDELVDLADDPAYAETIESMRLKVLNGWDPEAIAKIIKSRAADMDLLKSWAAKVEPEDPIRWNFNPNQNQLYRPMRATS